MSQAKHLYGEAAPARRLSISAKCQTKQKHARSTAISEQKPRKRVRA